MGIGDFILCILVPPLASGVRARGAGAVLGVFVLWLFLWIPGTVAAFILCLAKPKAEQPRQVIIYQQGPPPPQE